MTGRYGWDVHWRVLSISRTVSMILLYFVDSVDFIWGKALIMRRCCLLSMDMALFCILEMISCDDSDQPRTLSTKASLPHCQESPAFSA